MTLKELYDRAGGGYEEILGRFGQDEFIDMFVKAFVDEPSFGQLKAAMESGDMQEAFKMAHTLKGVCDNISFTRLREDAYSITEALRNGNDIPLAKEIFVKFEADYNETIEEIRKYMEG